MMPHPERASEPVLGGTDGMKIFYSVVGALAGNREVAAGVIP